jgi:hypothetical protein
MIIDDRTRNDNVVVHVAPGHGKRVRVRVRVS